MVYQQAWYKEGRAHLDDKDGLLHDGSSGGVDMDFHKKGAWFHKAQVGKSQMHHSGRSAHQSLYASI